MDKLKVYWQKATNFALDKSFFKDFLCIFLALMLAIIVVECYVTTPNQQTAEMCEMALNQYLEDPLSYLPKNNLIISIEDTTITASMPASFVFSTAKLKADGTYFITSNINALNFLMTRLLLFVFITLPSYFIFRFVTNLLILGYLKISPITKRFWITAKENSKKLDEAATLPQKEKFPLIYEEQELQQAYELGYKAGFNAGQTDGISKGAELAKNHLNSYSPEI